MTRAFVGLGSNVGDRMEYLRQAVEALRTAESIQVVACSSVYDTEPVDAEPGSPRFLNAAVQLRTSLSPRELLALCKRIEQRLGRRGGHRQPREIDLDLLLYDEQTVDEPDLRVPHPQLRRRAFALVPLLEIEPRLSLPTGEALSNLLAALGESQGVRRVGKL